MTSSSAPRGPKGHRFFGNALGLSRGALDYLRACAEEYGDLVPLRCFWKRILFVNHPDYIAQVLATNQRKVVKGVARRVDYALMGDGLSLSEGDAWLRERRMIQPAFHRERLAAYGAIMVALAERMIQTWRDGETRDICADFSKLSIAIVAKTMFDVDVWDDAALPRALAQALACRDARSQSLELFLPDLLPTPTNIKMKHARRKLDDLVDRIVEERRTANDDRGDLLSLLLHAQDEDGRGVSDEQVRDDLLTMIVAGTETVADLLSWTWYLLSQHPHVEAGLLTELEATLGGRSPTVSNLPRLPYTGMVVAEVLRLFPPAPALMRQTIAEVDVGGFRVARGTEIVVSQWVMHRDSRFFADPDRFDPNRWADGLASRLPPYAYFPFGGGPRLCIGKSFATMEAVLVLAAVAQRVRLELLPGHRVVPEEIPTLRPKYGLRMVVHARQRAGAFARVSNESVAR